MISKPLTGTKIYFKSKNIILGPLHVVSGALFGCYQECFNTFSTLIPIFINFGAERKHISCIILLVQIHIQIIMYLILSY